MTEKDAEAAAATKVKVHMNIPYHYPILQINDLSIQ